MASAERTFGGKGIDSIGLRDNWCSTPNCQKLRISLFKFMLLLYIYEYEWVETNSERGHSMSYQSKVNHQRVYRHDQALVYANNMT